MKLLIAFLRKIYFLVIYNDILKEHVERGLVVGKNFKMQNEVIIDSSCTWLIEIGDNVTLAPRVHILAHDASMKKFLNYAKIGKIKIGNRVFIGAGTIVLPGVTIGNDVVIGAGSVVTKSIPDGHVAVGNPAKIVCTLDDFLGKKRKEMAHCPCFGDEFTVKEKISDEMKNQMKCQMQDGFGYII